MSQPIRNELELPTKTSYQLIAVGDLLPEVVRQEDLNLGLQGLQTLHEQREHRNRQRLIRAPEQP